MPSSPGTAHPRLVYGVDFSAAAADAGTKTWIASGVVEHDDRLIIVDVAPLAEFLDLDAAARESCLPALATWIRGLDDDAVVGLDFPFGLPAFVVEAAGHDSWRSLLNGFPETLINDEVSADDPVRAFAERCVGATEKHGEGTYDKRETDAAVGARSPYGFIADTIAFHGMRDVLAPVADVVRVEPMDSLGNDRPETVGPTLVETYPAAVLDALGLYRTNYKGSSDAETTRRRRNAEGLAAESNVIYKQPVDLVDRIVDNDGGDALDAVAACLGAYAASESDYEVVIDGEEGSDAVALEGYIYALRGR